MDSSSHPPPARPTLAGKVRAACLDIAVQMKRRRKMAGAAFALGAAATLVVVGLGMVALEALLVIGVVAAVLIVAIAIARYFTAPVLEIHHLPARYPRRTHDLSANVTGRAHVAGRGRYRLNGGQWKPLPVGLPRVRRPNFTIELLDRDLRVGENEIELHAKPPLRAARTIQRTFVYDDSAVRLPLTIDWDDPAALEPQDGKWEIIETDAGRRARPAPGHEGYDRILNLTGAFPGGRRVETDIRFHAPVKDQFGLGSLLLWGGHPDPQDVRPRRGWVYGICWYLAPYGAGVEFQSKWGGGGRATCQAYTHLPEVPKAGDHYRFIAECWLHETPGQTPRFMARCKWWNEGEPEPPEWITVEEWYTLRLPQGREWSVALMAHNCAIDFGPVKISAIDGPTGDEDLEEVAATASRRA